MNMDSLVQRGGLPWSPNRAVSEVDVWQEYETPLVGTFVLNDETFLFTVIGTAAENGGSVWAYVAVDPDTPDHFSSVGEMRGFVTEAFRDKEAVLVVAVNLVVDRWARMKVTDLYSAANDFLDDVIQALPDPRISFHARLAGVDNVAANVADLDGGQRKLELI